MHRYYSVLLVIIFSAMSIGGWLMFSKRASAFVDNPVHNYQAPCRPGIQADVSTWHSGSVTRRAYDWRCQNHPTTPAEHRYEAYAPHSGQIAAIRSFGHPEYGTIFISDAENNACIVLLHLDASKFSVSENENVSRGQKIGEYFTYTKKGSTAPTSIPPHIHMVSLDGICQPGDDNEYTRRDIVHAKERPIVFREQGYALPPRITLDGTAIGSDGPKKWVEVGNCVNTAESDCSIPNDDNADQNNTSYPLSQYFNDVGHSKFAPFIDALKEERITNGCRSANARLFCPNDSLTRGQAAAFIVRSLGLTPRDFSSYSYPDIDGSGIFDNYIEYLTRINVVGGFSDGYFKPDLAVSRGQIAKMIVNTLQNVERSRYTCAPSGQAFPDIPTNHTFYSFIQCMYQLQITHGYSDGTYKSDNNVTRAQAAKLIYLAFLQEVKFFEQEPNNAGNNTKQGASILDTVGSALGFGLGNFTMPEGDQDWFRFTVPNVQAAAPGASGEYVMALEGGKNFNPCLTFQDESGNPVNVDPIVIAAANQAGLESSPDGILSIQLRGLQPGQTYYVGMENTKLYSTESVEALVYLQSESVPSAPTATTTPTQTSMPGTTPASTATATATATIISTATSTATPMSAGTRVATATPSSSSGQDRTFLPLVRLGSTFHAAAVEGGGPPPVRHCFVGNNPVATPTPIPPTITPTATPAIAYHYDVNTSAFQCGSQEPAANIIRARFEPVDSEGKIRVTVAKCNGTSYSKNGTIRIIRDNTGQFKNYEYKSETDAYRCGPGGIIKFQLLPNSGGLALRGTARKCDDTPFNADGYMYIYADGNRIAGPDRYVQGDTREGITFTPLELNAAGAHSYQAYFQSDNNAPGDYIVSGAVIGWEEYSGYLSPQFQAQAGQSQTVFMFDPMSLGLTGTNTYQIHVYPDGQQYPIRSGNINAWEVYN